MAAASYPATYATYESRVLARLLTTSETVGHWSATVIKDAINDARRNTQNELLNLYESRYFLRTRDQIAPQGRVIRLDTDVKRIWTFESLVGVPSEWVLVEIVDPVKATEAHYATVFRTVTDTRRSREQWSQIGDLLEYQGQSNPPGTQYRLRFAYQIADLQADQEVCPIPSEYQDLVVFEAASTLAMDAGQRERSMALMERRNERLATLRRTAASQNLGRRKVKRNTYQGFRRL